MNVNGGRSDDYFTVAPRSQLLKRKTKDAYDEFDIEFLKNEIDFRFEKRNQFLQTKNKNQSHIQNMRKNTHKHTYQINFRFNFKELV